MLSFSQKCNLVRNCTAHDNRAKINALETAEWFRKGANFVQADKRLEVAATICWDGERPAGWKADEPVRKSVTTSHAFIDLNPGDVFQMAVAGAVGMFAKGDDGQAFIINLANMRTSEAPHPDRQVKLVGRLQVRYATGAAATV